MKLWVSVLRRAGVAVILLGVVIMGAAIGSIATADGAAAQQIVVQGNRRVEASTIQSYFRLAPGERLDDFKLDTAYKALLNTGLFQDVQIRRAGAQIVVTVVEAPVLNRVQFEGNRRVKDDVLVQEVQSKPRGTFSRPVVQADVQRILEIYRAAGRYDIRVEPKIIELPNNRVDLVFEVTEGPKTTVKRINFVGNKAFSDGRLSDVIKTAQTGLLSFLKSADVYDRDRIEADRELLRRFYLKSGYADIRIVSTLTEFDPEVRGFVVTFSIEEGDLYRFGTVEVVSTVRDVDPGALRGAPEDALGRRVQRRGGGEDGRGHDRRDVEARLCVRAGAPTRRPRLPDAHHQRQLRGRAGRARLHRAAQYPRQFAHPRLCHPARVRDRRG